jgi:hypothetical protein
MAMGRKRDRQQEMWIATNELPRSRGHIFYDWANQILNAAGFDKFAEAECIGFYKSETMGPPEHRAWRVFSDAADRVLRRNRLRARHCVEMRRFAESEEFPGIWD